jgi:uncharacterized protein YjeT (DUF2065 family)
LLVVRIWFAGSGIGYEKLWDVSASHRYYLQSHIMKLLILLIGMVLILEGMPYVAAPEAMREWLQKLSQVPARQLRGFGLVAMGIGLFICWIVQRSPFF